MQNVFTDMKTWTERLVILNCERLPMSTVTSGSSRMRVNARRLKMRNRAAIHVWTASTYRVARGLEKSVMRAPTQESALMKQLVRVFGQAASRRPCFSLVLCTCFNVIPQESQS
jgi:hypothetical protein